MRKLVSVTMVGVMMLTLFFGLYGGVVEKGKGTATYDSGTNTIYVEEEGNSLATILSIGNPSVFYLESLNTYVTNANIQINGSSDLTINAGEILKFNGSLGVTVSGRLYVNGIEGNMATFTSNETAPSAGDWQGLIFNTSEASNSDLNYLNVSYATVGIFCDGSSPTITNSVITICSDNGILSDGASPIINDVEISNNGDGVGFTDAGLFVISSSPIIENSTLINNPDGDFLIQSNSHPVSLNSSLGLIVFRDANSNLTVKWYLHVYVEDNITHSAIPDATVWVRDLYDDVVGGSPFTTDMLGYVRWIQVVEHVRTISTTTPYTPHNITAIHDEYYTGYAEPEPTIDSSMQVQVNLTMIRRDLTTNRENITFSTPGVPVAGEDLTVYAKIHNIEIDAARDVRVIIVDNAPEGSQEIHNSTISEIKGNSYKYAIDVWKPTPGTHIIEVFIDPYNEINEINNDPGVDAENNNEASKTISVNARPIANISEPANNAEVNETVTIEGTSYDDPADDVAELPGNDIARIDLSLVDYDWISLYPPFIPNITSGGWDWFYDWDTYHWNNTPLSDGNYTLQVKAWDNYHFSHPYEINITINNTGANEPPVAIINEPLNNSHFSVNESIGFNGSLSYDPDNDILTYEWAFDDGNFASDNVTYHAFSEKGMYNVTLTVNDSRVQNVSYVTVIIDNSPPYAELTASADTVYVNQTITFYGYNSTDEENPDNLIFFWDYDDTEDTNGDGNYTNDIDNLTMSPIENTTHSYDQPDTYTITLAVWDGRINSTAIVTVTIQANAPPEAVINSPSPLDSFSVNETIVFNASSSSDPNDLDLLYKWEFGDGQETTWLTTPITTYAYKNKASVFTGYTYIVNVTVSDGSAEDTASVNILVGNYMPVAISKANQTEAQTNNEITFWANDSYDPDYPANDIVNFTWDFGDGEIYTETVADAPDGSFDGITTHEYADDGVYIVKLTVTDNALTENPARNSTIISITITNRPPAIISAMANPQTAKIGETIYFNVTASDEDGTLVKYEWNFGDGYQDFTATLGNATHSFDTKGEHTVGIRVTDDDGATNTEDVIVNIVNNPPVVNITSPDEDQTVSEIVTIQGKASDADGSVSIVEIRIDGGVWDSATDTSGNGSWFSWTYDWDTEDDVTNGQHTIYARANDSESGTEPPASVTVTVENEASSITVTEFLNPSSADAGGAVEVYGDVTYNTGEEVVGADVNITIIDEEGEWVGTTDANGHYSIDITAPEGAGNFWVKVIVTKGSLSGQNQKRLEVIAKPDLAITASDIDFNPSAPFSGETVQITITVRNNGDANANNFLVNAYDGDPDAGGDPIDSDTVSVSAKSDNSVALNWDTSGKSGTHFVYIVLDPSDTIDESNEDNNKASRPLTIKGKPDFAIDSADITFSKTDPKAGDTITIRIKIHNNGPEGGMVTYEVYDGDPGIGVEIGSGQESIPANGDETVTVEWTIEDGGDHDIYVVLDPDDEVDEGDEDNNEADKSITVEAGPGEGGIPSWLIPLTVILVVAVFVVLLLLYFRERGPKPEKELPVAKVVQKEAKAGAVKVGEEKEEEEKTLMESHGGVRI